jgi:hypothetical protein
MDTISAGQRLTLHLGVTVVQYRSHDKKVMAVTTADVAQWLENKYELFTAFYKTRGDEIGEAMEGSLQGALEALMMGQRVDPFGSAMSKIESAFRDFISSRQAERVGIPGTPTLAALMGVNHRLAHPYSSRNPRRPSFRDTGTLMAAFKAWTD